MDVRERGECLRATVAHILENVRGDKAAYAEGMEAYMFLDWPTQHNRPAAWCIAHVLGLEAVDAGGRTVRVKPFLGDLEWAEGALPTPLGVVRVRHERRPDGSITTRIDAPPGVKTIDGGR